MSISTRSGSQVPPSGRIAELTARLQSVRTVHPRLHFGPDGQTQLRKRAAGTHSRYARPLSEWVQRHREWGPPVGLPPNQINEVVLEESAAFLSNAALAAVIGGDAEAARRWALAMCELPQDESANYGLGIYAAGLARAYDWLYDIWSDDEREHLRSHIAALVRRLDDGSVPGGARTHWWAGAHLHHDFWVPVCGYGEAALALLGEVAEAATWAARARHEMEVCFSWLGEDGSWHEGAADWCYALAPLLWFYGAWQSVTGEDPHDIPWLRATALYRLYHRLPDGTYVYLNDSFRSGRYNTSGSAACHLLRRLASLFRDPHAQWLAERDEEFDLRPGPKGVYQAPYEGSSLGEQRTEYPHPDSQCAAWNLLWYDPSIDTGPPDGLPRSRRFENGGVAILRSGWDEDAAVVSLACGPVGGEVCGRRIRSGEFRSASNVSHSHADYNALTLFARGQYVIIPAGYARRSSSFQNTVSVNGADFSVDPALDVRLGTVVEEPDFCYAVGDAAAAFPPSARVAHYRRHLVLLDGCLILFDDLQLADLGTRNWNRFEWRLHSDPATHTLAVDRTRATWTAHAGSGRLTLEILAPVEFAWEQSTLCSRSGTPLLEVLRLVRPEWYSSRMQVLAVFAWEEQPAQPVLWRSGNWVGAAWPEHIGHPSIAFALAAAEPATHEDSVPPEGYGQRLILLGPDWVRTL